MLIFRDFLVALRLAFRANLSWMVAGLLLVVALVMLLSSYFGARQPVTVALDVGFSTIRLLLPLLVVLLAQELLSREFEKRYYLNSLTCPRSRYLLLLGRFSALFAILLGVLSAVALLQVFLVEVMSDAYPQSTPVTMGRFYIITVAFLALDLLVLAAMATMLAVFASTSSFVLIGTFGFMLVARSYGSILELLGRQIGLVSNFEGYRVGLGVLGYLLPDLGALDVRMLALYGKPEFLPSDWPWLLLSNLAYAFTLLLLAVWALQRKRFV